MNQKNKELSVGLQCCDKAKANEVICKDCMEFTQACVESQSEENKQLPTAVQLLDILVTEVFSINEETYKGTAVPYRQAIAAMKQFRDLHTAPLREELDKLRAENERLKNANTRLAERVEDENEKYCNSLDQVSRLCEMMLRAQDQNQKLREPLEKIANEAEFIGRTLANKALKGGDNVL